MFEKLDVPQYFAQSNAVLDAHCKFRDLMRRHIIKCESHIDELEQRVAELTKGRDQAIETAHKAVADRGELVNQITKLTKERDEARDAVRVEMTAEREPRDNGDGTVTQLLPVTYDAKWRGRVKAVRPPRNGDVFVDSNGFSGTAAGNFSSRSLRLILSPPTPSPEPVTWRAPLADGEWEVHAPSKYAMKVVAHGKLKPVIDVDYSCDNFCGFTRPPRPGRYLFSNGVGKWQGDA